MRCFVSLELPEEIRKKILEVQKLLEESMTFEGKLTKFENIHLTLKFLGEINEGEIGGIVDRLDRVNWGPFESGIDSAGVFSKKFVRIIWLKLKGTVGFQRKIDFSLRDIFSQEERFMSHITIARVKRVINKDKLLEELEKIKLKDVRFKVDSFYLRKSELTSEGPEYSVLKKFKSNE